MTLYEFSGLITINIVVAAETEADAMAKIASFSADGLVRPTGHCDVGDLTDVELVDVREPGRARNESEPLTEWLQDEAHVVA